MISNNKIKLQIIRVPNKKENLSDNQLKTENEKYK